MKNTKGAQVTARLHESTKHKLLKTGYNAAQAIEWFVNEYYSNHPKKQLEIRQDLEEIELNKLKKVECEIQLEIAHKERVIADLIQEQGEYPEIVDDLLQPVDEILDIPEDGSSLSDGELEAIERVRPVWEVKRDLMVGRNDDEVEVFNAFILLNGDFLNDVHKECCKNLSFKEFKALLIEGVVKA